MFVPTGQVIEGEWRSGKNVAIHNVSQSTSISDISLTDLGDFGGGGNPQIPNVPVTVSLEGQNSLTVHDPRILQSNGVVDNNPSYYYSANYHPPSLLHSNTQGSNIIPP